MTQKIILKKCILFFLIFTSFFYLIQNVLRYKWENDEFISSRLEYYAEEKDNTIDILFFGSSPIYAGITPIIMWDEVGVTGINFGISLQNAMCNYYQLKYALQKQTPSVVVLDFSALFEDRMADEDSYEATYRKVAETIPDKKLKYAMVKDITLDNENQDRLSYYFPLLRYHGRWNEISKTDFIPDKVYKSYFKGALLSTARTSIAPVEETYYNLDKASISQYSLQYYKKIINLCNEKNIRILAISLPIFDSTFNYARFDILSEFCSEYGIDYINYNSEEYLDDLKLDLKMDYYDSGHMNINGSSKVTKDLGRRLKELYDLADHSQDTAYSDWGNQWNLFVQSYGGVLE